jgi:hypothetical protein
VEKFDITLGSDANIYSSCEQMKKFSRVEDLALFGGAPAFESPLHVGKPNIGNRQTLLQRMNDILEGGWLTNYGPLVKQFESALANELGARHCVAM